MKLDKHRLFTLTLLTIILAIFVTRFDFDIFNFSSQNVEKKAAIAKLNKVLKVVDRYYVDTLAWKDVSTGAIEGLLKTLDPHSVYFDPKAVEQNEESFNGRYYGIGIQFDVYTLLIEPKLEGGQPFTADINLIVVRVKQVNLEFASRKADEFCNGFVTGYILSVDSGKDIRIKELCQLIQGIIDCVIPLVGSVQEGPLLQAVEVKNLFHIH